jgi:ribonuclease HI
MEYPEEGALNIYTDGSCLPKPRRGGLAGLFILINDDGVSRELLRNRIVSGA